MRCNAMYVYSTASLHRHPEGLAKAEGKLLAQTKGAVLYIHGNFKYHLYIVQLGFSIANCQIRMPKKQTWQTDSMTSSLTAKSRRSSASSIMAFSRPSCNTTAVG